MLAIAAQTGSALPTLVEAAEPGPPGAGDVLCRTVQLGVCGTDREILLSAQPWTPAGEDHLVLGHECLARVVQVGTGVHQLCVGDLVVPVVRRAVKETAVRVDMLAFGEYTERGIVREHGFSLPRWLDRPEHLFRVPAEIESVVVLTEPLSVAEKGVNEALAVQRGRLGGGVWVDEPPRILITGMGPIAFAAVLACRGRQWPVTMYGRDSEQTFRAALARSLAARYLAADRLADEPLDVERDGYDLILECTGSDEVLLRVARHLAARGVLVWLGSSRVPQPRPHNLELLMRMAVLRNHLHLGSVNAAPRDFQQAIQHLHMLWRDLPGDVEALITERVAPDEALWHYQHRRPQGIKTVVMYD